MIFEQRDWFADDIGFVRRLLRPAQRTIDIGANYGVYALTRAKIVGPMEAVGHLSPRLAPPRCCVRVSPPLIQILWSNALYVPDLTRLDHMEPSASQASCLLHEIYGSYDLYHVVLSIHDLHCGTSHSQRYLELLARQ